MWIKIIVTGLCLLAPAASRAQHGHLNAGAANWDPGSKLNFKNGADFVAESGYLKTLVYSNTGTFASTYNGNISLTALHSFDEVGGAIAGSPAPGSFVVAEIVSLSGPAGGSFSLWQGESPQLVVPAGTTNGAFRYELSDATLGAGQAGSDPFGHIHGRRFSLDKPGIYTVGVRTIDISTNGTGGGPIHTPSDILPIVFQAGINISSVERDGDHTHVTFGSLTNYLWRIESTDALSPLNWQPVGDAVNGTDLFIEVDDPRPAATSRFYRATGQFVAP